MAAPPPPPPAYEGFRYVEDDDEYELALTPNVKIDFAEGGLRIRTEFPDGIDLGGGVRALHFTIGYYLNGNEFIVRLEGRWFAGGIRLTTMDPEDGNPLLIQTVYGPAADFRQFAEWLYRNEMTVLAREDRMLHELFISDPPRIRIEIDVIKALLVPLMTRPALEVPTLLTSPHREAISQEYTRVSMPGGAEIFYYVLNATDVQIQGNVDRYTILNIENLIGVLCMFPHNDDPLTRAPITRIRRIKFTLQPIVRAQLGPAPLARKRASSFGGGRR